VWLSTFFTTVTSFVYNLNYAPTNNRLVLVFETVNDIETVVYQNGSWGTPLTMIDSVNSAGSPVISTNGTDYLVAWKEIISGGARSINTRRYDATTGTWDSGSIIDSYTPVFGGGVPEIASNGSGFMVTWGRDDGTNDISLYTSSCDASGVCTAASLLESLIGNIGHYEIASNGTGYGVAFAHTIVMGVTHDGVSWGAPVNLGSKPGNQSLKLTSNGDGYLAAWYTFETNWPVYASRYTTTSGWSALVSIKSTTGSVGTFDWFQIYPVGLQYLVTWNSYKPGYSLQMKNLYTNMWSGSTWGGEQQVNTGKFDVSSFAVDTTNNAARLSWVQAHESLFDEAAKALWELVL